MPASRKNAHKKKALHTGTDSVPHLRGLVNENLGRFLPKIPDPPPFPEHTPLFGAACPAERAQPPVQSGPGVVLEGMFYFAGSVPFRALQMSWVMVPMGQ